MEEKTITLRKFEGVVGESNETHAAICGVAAAMEALVDVQPLRTWKGSGIIPCFTDHNDVFQVCAQFPGAK